MEKFLKTQFIKNNSEKEIENLKITVTMRLRISNQNLASQEKPRIIWLPGEFYLISKGELKQFFITPLENKRREVFKLNL